jgi:hypothetical protein
VQKAIRTLAGTACYKRKPHTADVHISIGKMRWYTQNDLKAYAKLLCCMKSEKGLQIIQIQNLFAINERQTMNYEFHYS